MRKRNLFRRIIVTGWIICLALITSRSDAQNIPTPQSVIGFEIGSDYNLASYEQSIEYFKTLEAASDYIKLVQVGYTAYGRPWYLSIISSPENLKNLEHYREIAQKIAHPDDYGLTDEQARTLAKEGKAFVDINGGLHATEVAHAQHDIVLAYKLISEQNKPEIRQILDNVVFLLWPSLNPDGQTLMVDWYNKIKKTEFENAPMHQLYQKYIGHDNNRDGYMLNTQESRVVINTWRHWEPQLIHIHHQMGGRQNSRIWMLPNEEPIAKHAPPLIYSQINAVGMLMDLELQSHGLSGITHRGSFDGWYPGYIDNVPVFQNIVTYITETSSNNYANPRFYNLTDFPQEDRDLRAHSLNTNPWPGGWWRLSDMVEYMIHASMGGLKYAAQYKEQLIYNRYQSGRNTIEYYKENAPYAYIIPQYQQDPMAAVEMLRRLAFNGIRVQQLTRQATYNGRIYPEGTWIIPTQQPFAQFVREVLDVQAYPDLREYPGGPIRRVYDAVGWTLPYSMGVEYEQAEIPLDQEFKSALRNVEGTPIPWDSSEQVSLMTNKVAAGIQLPKRNISGSGNILAVSPAENNSFKLINRALAAGGKINFEQSGDSGSSSDASYLVSGVNRNTLQSWAEELSLTANWVNTMSGQAIKPRIGIYSSYTSNMDEGWTRWLMDQFEFKYTRIRNDEMKKGGLEKKYDVIIFANVSSFGNSNPIIDGHSPETMPAPYAGGIGEEGVKALDAFVKAGGTMVALNQTSEFAITQLKLPVTNKLKSVGGVEFNVGGSVLEVQSTANSPIMAGMESSANIFFQNSPAFSTQSGFEGEILARYASMGSPLKSGLLVGEQYLHGEAAAVKVKHGKGNVVLFGFSPQWRGQTFGTFRMLFNSLFIGSLDAPKL